VKPRFQADADFNRRIVIGLRRREPAIDFKDAHTGGIVDLPDPAVLLRSAALDRIVVSHDRKTMPAHFAQFLTGHSSPGLIIVPQDLAIGDAIDDLLLLWAATEAEDWRGKVGFLPL
jgi:hypothetical protein